MVKRPEIKGPLKRRLNFRLWHKARCMFQEKTPDGFWWGLPWDVKATWYDVAEAMELSNG